MPEEARDDAETEAWVKKAGSKAVVITGDLQQEQHCKGLIERAVKEFGSLDNLVNNAAFQTAHESIEEFTAEEFDRTFRTNLYATFMYFWRRTNAVVTGEIYGATGGKTLL